MAKKNWKIYTLWIALAEIVGAISGILSMEGMKSYQETALQPILTPPAWVFPVVWSILFALMGISAARISLSPQSVSRTRSLNLYIAQLVVNFFWPLLFFNAQVFGFALLWLILLWVLVLLLVITAWQVDKTAALLLIPYIIWLSFAVYLNTAVWMLNS